MNMRISAFSSSDGSNTLSISFDNGHIPVPGRMTGLNDSETKDGDDPFDIGEGEPFGEPPPEPSSFGPGNSGNPMDRGFLQQLMLILALLSLRNQDDELPPAEGPGKGRGKGKGGGAQCGPGAHDNELGDPDSYSPYWPDGKDQHHFYDGKDKTSPVDGKHKTGPGEGNDKTGPGEGNDKTGPGEGNDKTRPADGNGKTSAAGGPGKMPPPTGTVTVNEPIVVKAGQTFDGGGKLYKAGAALGDGGQSEGQKPVFILEPGATLKNLQYEGADGIHTMGDATIKDVWARDVGEDAMTMKKPGNVTWSGGGAFNANDKIFQLNAGGSFTLENFTADNFGKAVRTNGGKQIETDITIRNSRFTNGDESIVRTDSTVATITLQNNMFSNVPNDVLAPSGTQVSGAVKRGSK